MDWIGPQGALRREVETFICSDRQQTANTVPLRPDATVCGFGFYWI